MPLARWRSTPVATRLWLLAVTGSVVVAAVVATGLWHGRSQAKPVATAPRVQTELGPVDDDQDQPPTAPPPAALVMIRTVAGHAVLTDAGGYTLYTFSVDSAQTSRCTGECARRWLPLTSAGGKPQAGSGASLAQVGSIQRADGSYQVTYNGWPLYHFIGDTSPNAQDGAGRTEYGGSFNSTPPAANRS